MVEKLQSVALNSAYADGPPSSPNIRHINTNITIAQHHRCLCVSSDSKYSCNKNDLIKKKIDH